MPIENEKILSGHIKDLARRAYENNFITCTNFLSASELAQIDMICKRDGYYTGEKEIEGARFCLYGGANEADRVVMAFLPEYLDEESFIAQEKEASDIVKCVCIAPANARFADELTHRDFLGSIMNLQIERDRIGDIRTDHTKAYVFVTGDVAELLCSELVRIKHTTVKCSIVPVTACDIEPAFKAIEGTVASERLDAILSFVYKLSRNESARLVEEGAVAVDGHIAFNGGYDLKAGARVSVRGHGKFIYDGAKNITKKGRTLIGVRIYV